MEEALRVAGLQHLVLRIFVYLPDMQPPAQRTPLFSRESFFFSLIHSILIR
jgi:hypothetical protein